MLNDFEILIWAIYLKETILNRNDFIDYLSTSALFVKKDLNEPDVFKIFETFFAHNHYDAYAKYASSNKPQVTLTLRRINFYNMTLLAPFEVQNDKDIQDFNYEVDALEDEHIRREVHTTRVVMDEEHLKINKEAAADQNYTETIRKNNKRVKKVKSKPKAVHKSPVQVIKPIKKEAENKFTTTNTIKDKREHKKSFDFYNPDDRSDNISESPFSIQPKFNSLAPISPTIRQNEVKKEPILKFSEIGENMKTTENKNQDSNLYPFGNPGSANLPSIPAPFNNRPKPSMESIGGGIGAFDHIEDPVGFVSREFMMDRSQDNQNDQKGFGGLFKVNFNPFASNEYGRSIEPNEISRNLLHPTPKYQK